MMREEHVKNNTVTKVCPAFDSRSNQCAYKNGKIKDERKERESVCVLLVARFGLLLVFSTLSFPLIIVATTTTTTQRV